jgi:hypothetical protein
VTYDNWKSTNPADDTGEKMKQQKPRPKRVKVPAGQEIDRPEPSREAVMVAADRAEARSRLNKSK